MLNDTLYHFRKGQFTQVYGVYESSNKYHKVVKWMIDHADGMIYVAEFHDAIVNEYLETGYWHKTDWKGEETLDSYFAALSRGSF